MIRRGPITPRDKKRMRRRAVRSVWALLGVIYILFLVGVALSNSPVPWSWQH